MKIKSKYIKMNDLADILQVVRLALHVDGDVTATRGVYSIDCKSIMGVLALDFSNGVTVTYPKTAHELNKFLKSFEVVHR